jgi:CubicO group peptidase (beta-lactamase class C family)
MARGSFAADGLAYLHRVLEGHVTRGALPGLVALVARGDHVHVDVIGTKAFGDAEPMPRDAVFRIASLTKPITAAAAMVLVDDGVLNLDDPVDAFLPELADRRVLRSLDAELDDTAPAARAITLEDLLTFRLGFGAVMAMPGTYPIQAAADALGLNTTGPPWPPTANTPDEWIRRFGMLPLISQPGEQWMYGTSAQVTGVLVARAAGVPFETFLRERIFEPLGMHDTAFSIMTAQRDRFTTAYSADPETGVVEVLDGVDDSWWSRRPAFPDGAGWLVSTVDDFWSFVRMILCGGAHDGGRILTEDAVAGMTTNHLTVAQRAANPIFLEG